MKSFLIAIVFLLASTSTSFAQYKERREKGQYRGRKIFSQAFIPLSHTGLHVFIEW